MDGIWTSTSAATTTPRPEVRTLHQRAVDRRQRLVAVRIAVSPERTDEDDVFGLDATFPSAEMTGSTEFPVFVSLTMVLGSTRRPPPEARGETN